MILASSRLEKEITKVTNNPAVNNQENDIGESKKVEIDEGRVSCNERNNQIDEKKDLVKEMQ